MILLTSLYHDADANRRGQLFECLRRECSAEQLDEVHVFIGNAMMAEGFKSRTETVIDLVNQS